MHPRVQSLIADLDLHPHPEGGYYREIFRSASRVQPGDHRAERSALTAIYFLLVAGQHSGWHQVLSTIGVSIGIVFEVRNVENQGH